MRALIPVAVAVVAVVAVVATAGCSSPPPAERESVIAADTWQEEIADRQAAIERTRSDAPEESDVERAVPSEPTTEQPALDRLNAASDRVDAALSEMNRTCAPPADYDGAMASAKCIGRVLTQVCPGIGEGALTDMSRAALDMGASEASWSLEQAAQDCWNAVFYADMPSGGTNPRQVGASVTRMGEKIGEASALLH